MSNTKNIMGLGFIDLLAGFMVASIALMIIIKYGTEQGSEVAGYPKDYMLYTAEVSLQNPSQELQLKDLYFNFLIKTPSGQWLSSAIDSNGNKWSEDKGFIIFEGSKEAVNFYGIGPSFHQSEDGENTATYHIYGVEETRPDEEWKIGIRYYSNKKLENGELNDKNWANVINSKVAIKHSLEYLGSQKEVLENETLNTVVLGEEIFKTIEYIN